ncbi:MAG TPA: hypothetical protein PLT45_03765 [Smithella sp.]|nr:hypothetical protein [Smithella sp.]
MKADEQNLLIRCPKLGDEMTLSYCLRESGDLPCTRVIRCWSPFFDVEKFLKDTLTPGQWEAFAHAKPPDKITNLLDLIEAAKAKK